MQLDHYLMKKMEINGTSSPPTHSQASLNLKNNIQHNQKNKKRLIFFKIKRVGTQITFKEINQ